MLVALLSEVGTIKIKASITKKIRKQIPLDEQDKKEFHRMPDLSLATVLDRKLSIEEKSRSILISTYEHADGSGFPRAITDQKLTVGAQLIRLARDFDQATILRLGKARPDPKLVMQNLISNAEPNKIFTRDFIQKIGKQILKADIFQ